eukprot:321019_1
MLLINSFLKYSNLVTNCTNFIINHWVKHTKKFPKDLYKEIGKYFQVIAVFDDIMYGPKKLLNMIRISETAKRYDDMAQLMILYLQIVKYDNIDYGTYMIHIGHTTHIYQKRDFVLLGYEERSSMVVAFQNAIKCRKNSYEKLVDDNGNKSKTKINKEYLEMIQSEIFDIYITVINVLEYDIIPKCKVLINEECKKIDGEINVEVYSE